MHCTASILDCDIANQARLFYGLLHDTELMAALADDGDSEEENETTADAKDGKEKPPKVWFYVCVLREYFPRLGLVNRSNRVYMTAFSRFIICLINIQYFRMLYLEIKSAVKG